MKNVECEILNEYPISSPLQNEWQIIFGIALIGHFSIKTAGLSYVQEYTKWDSKTLRVW